MLVKRGRRMARQSWLFHAAVPLAFVGTLVFWPFLEVVQRAFADPLLATDTPIVEQILSHATFEAAFNTVSLAALGTAGSVALGVPASYALYRLRWRGANALRALITVPFVLPTVVVAAGFSAMFGRGGPLSNLGMENTFVIITLALVFYNISVVSRVVGTAWENLDPSFKTSAQSLGASRWRAFLHCTLPLLTPAILGSATLVFLFCASSFGLVIVLGQGQVHTLETSIYLAVTSYLDLRLAATLSLIQAIIVGAALWMSHRFQHASSRALHRTGLVGWRQAQKSDAFRLIAALMLPTLLIVGPVAALFERSLRTRNGYSFQNYIALAQPTLGTALSGSVIDALARSVSIAVAATATCMVIAMLTTRAVLVQSAPHRFLELVTSAPLAMSSVMVGLGLLISFGSVALDWSWLLLALGQAVVALPFVTRVLIPAARAIDPKMRMAAASLGASSARVWLKVDLMVLRRPLRLAAGFAFAMSLGEFGATAFLARPSDPTLPVAIVRLLSRPGAESIGMAAAGAVVLGLLTTVAIALAEAQWRVRGASKLYNARRNP